MARGTPSPNPKLTWSSSLTTLSLLGRISATRLALDRSTTTCTNLIGFGGKEEEEVEEKNRTGKWREERGAVNSFLHCVRK